MGCFHFNDLKMFFNKRQSMDKGPINGWTEFVVMQVYESDLGNGKKKELWLTTTVYKNKT